MPKTGSPLAVIKAGCHYNHARRLRLEIEKLSCLELSRSPNGFFYHFRIQVVVSEVKRPLNHRSGIEAVTDKSARSGATVTKRPWPLAKDNGFILVWGLLCWCLSTAP
jgi:hypothetical protein